MLPTDLFEDYSLETVDTVQGIFIPLTSIAGLTAAEANATTGDGREVFRALVAQAYSNIATLPTKPTSVDYALAEAVLTESRKRTDYTFSFTVTVPQSAYQIAD